MSVQPVLVILAAGLGSRFGGNKQIEKIGPSGECIMDYSVYDAIKAGFGKVIFVISKSFKEGFIDCFNAERFNHLIQLDYAFQEMNQIPDGFTYSSIRTKPWGTNHALMMAKHLVSEPFAVINADDFYGRNAFIKIGEHLKSIAGKEHQYGMIGYNILNTLVKSGGTSRAECITDQDNNLIFIEERTEVQSINGSIEGLDVNKTVVKMNDNAIVSMNCWGFTPDYFNYSDECFRQFLSKHQDSNRAEFLIPTVVNKLISEQKVNVKVLHSDAEWFGLTFQTDKTFVTEKLMKLIHKELYPTQLWLK